MDEATFCFLVDCRFPFADESMATRVVELACSISPNAAYAVVYELACPGRGMDTTVELRRRMLGLINEQLMDPAKGIVLPLARRLLDGVDVPEEDVVAALRELAKCPPRAFLLDTLSYGCEPGGAVDSAANRTHLAWHGTEWSGSEPEESAEESVIAVLPSNAGYDTLRMELGRAGEMHAGKVQCDLDFEGNSWEDGVPEKNFADLAFEGRATVTMHELRVLHARLGEWLDEPTLVEVSLGNIDIRLSPKCDPDLAGDHPTFHVRHRALRFAAETRFAVDPTCVREFREGLELALSTLQCDRPGIRSCERFIAEIPEAHRGDGLRWLVLEYDPRSKGWFLFGHESLEHARAWDNWHLTREDALDDAADWGVEPDAWTNEEDLAP